MWRPASASCHLNPQIMQILFKFFTGAQSSTNTNIVQSSTPRPKALLSLFCRLNLFPTSLTAISKYSLISEKWFWWKLEQKCWTSPIASTQVPTDPLQRAQNLPILLQFLHSPPPNHFAAISIKHFPPIHFLPTTPIPHICHLRHQRRKCTNFPQLWKNTKINAKITDLNKVWHPGSM